MKKLSLFLLAIFLIAQALGAQGKTLSSLEFRDKPIADILLALGEAGQLSIVPDSTIIGNASYYFSDMSVEAALSKFAASFSLYVKVKDGIYYVSKIDSTFDPVSGLASLNAEDVRFSLVVRAFSRTIGRTILFDEIPDRPVTIHAASMNPEAIAQILAKSIPSLSLEVSSDYFSLRRAEPAKPSPGSASHSQTFTRNGNLFSLDAHRISYLDLIGDLFNAMGKDYSMLSRNDAVIDGLSFKDRDFQSALSLILEQVNADYAVIDGIYYIFDIQRKDILKKLKANVVLPIENFSVSDIVSLLPPDFSASGMLRFDKSANTIYLSGSLEEIQPIENFLRQIDIAPLGRSYERFDLKGLKAKDAIGLLPSRFASLSPVALPDGTGFVALVSSAMSRDLKHYLDLIDSLPQSDVIPLRFAKPEDVLKNLPPPFTKDDVVDAGNGTTLFFVGSKAKKKAFLEDLGVLDRPKPQIRYDVLVVQYTIQDNMDATPNIVLTPVGGASVSSATDPTGLVAALGGLLALKFDAIAELGLNFAATLNWNLENDRAQIFADTTLYGIVGKDLKFQNTTTYRYKDTVTDTSGNTTSSVTREVSSGLILAMNGWVSGDGMITVDVNATTSERTDSSTSDTTAPTTSERVITTQVRTPSGRPISIGGLRQRKTELVVKKIPILSSLPFIGKAFQSTVDKDSDTEIVIYLVPYLTEQGESADSDIFKLESIYRDLVKGY